VLPWKLFRWGTRAARLPAMRVTTLSKRPWGRKRTGDSVATQVAVKEALGGSARNRSVRRASIYSANARRLINRSVRRVRAGPVLAAVVASASSGRARCAGTSARSRVRLRPRSASLGFPPRPESHWTKKSAMSFDGGAPTSANEQSKTPCVRERTRCEDGDDLRRADRRKRGARVRCNAR
jgi:hypothetical protein